MNITTKENNFNKNLFGKILICVLIVLASWIIGALLETLVYCIPTDPIRENISRGINIYNVETNFYMYADGYYSTMNDNDSDSVILCETGYSTGRPLYDAMASAHPYGNEARVNDIIAWSFFHDDDYSIEYYSRYWHGYVTLFKPLFYFFSFADMRVIKYIVELFLYAVTGFFLLTKTDFGKEYSIAYLSVLVMLNPVIIALAFQYMPCTYIALLTTIVILKCKVKVWDDKLIYIMLISGILTSFFDFLTFPIITLGIPLAVTLLYDGNVVRKIKSMIGVSFAWSFGYIGMWVGKWILSSVVVGFDVIGQAFHFVQHRTGNLDPETTRIKALFHVARVMIKRPYVLFYFAVLIYLLIKYIIPVIKKKKLSEMAKQFLPFAILALYSVVWIMFTFQHCFENIKFTYRNYAVMAFALIIGVIYSGNYALKSIAEHQNGEEPSDE